MRFLRFSTNFVILFLERPTVNRVAASFIITMKGGEDDGFLSNSPSNVGVRQRYDLPHFFTRFHTEKIKKKPTLLPTE